MRMGKPKLQVMIDQILHLVTVILLTTSTHNPGNQTALGVHAHVHLVSVEVFRPLDLLPVRIPFDSPVLYAPLGIRVTRLLTGVRSCIIFCRVDVGHHVGAVHDLHFAEGDA